MTTDIFRKRQVNMSVKASKQVEQLVRGIDREQYNWLVIYWGKLRPSTLNEKRDAIVYALISTNNKWQPNVKMYRAYKKLQPGFTIEQLTEAFAATRSGQHITKAQKICAFLEKWNNNPYDYSAISGESFAEFRKRLIKNKLVKGLKMAKASFALEMLEPLRADVVCLDRWMIRLYGRNPKSTSDTLYVKMERHFVKICRKMGFHPAIARHIIWNMIRPEKYYNTRHWSSVLEPTSVKDWADKEDKGNPHKSTHPSSQPQVGHTPTTYHSKTEIFVQSSCLQTVAG